MVFIQTFHLFIHPKSPSRSFISSTLHFRTILIQLGLPQFPILSMVLKDKLAKLATQNSKPSPSKKGKGKGKKKKKVVSEPMPCVVQTLFDTCREVFDGCGPGIVPTSGNIQRLQSILDSMKPADVGLSPKLPYFRPIESIGAPPITYLHLYECPKFSIGIFCLPPSAVIPLHNHPGMTGFIKLLFGSMHIKSYDWIEALESSNGITKPSHIQDQNLRLAKVKTDALFTAPCATSILYPTSGGNMHRFTAKTSCAVLDVLGPPYDDSQNRHCTYYNDFPSPSMPGDSSASSVSDHSDGEVQHSWLEERGRKPDELVVVGARYDGPKIVEH